MKTEQEIAQNFARSLRRFSFALSDAVEELAASVEAKGTTVGAEEDIKYIVDVLTDARDQVIGIYTGLVTAHVPKESGKN